MAQRSIRAFGPTESKWLRATLRAVALTPALSACVSYEPAPVDVSRILADLESARFEHASPLAESGNPMQPGASGADPRQLASFAITHNPALGAARSRISVASALLVQAGLLTDPKIGWDGMDALASQIVSGSVSSVDVLSGLGLSVTLPRPGEFAAKKGAARWRFEEVRQRVLAAEWRLTGEVYVACEDVLEADQLLEQNRSLAEVARTTEQYFRRAREAGAATAIQANLATGDLLSIRAQEVRLESRLREARYRLNALLGLPPSTLVPIVQGAIDTDAESGVEGSSVEALVEASLIRRPDLAALLAAYRAAEEDVRLEVRRQLPLLVLGTGINLRPGLFTHFNRPAIRTAIARRLERGQEIEARVHEVRRQIHDARASHTEARQELSFLEAQLLPNAEASLRLARTSFDAGEVTLLEILTLQRSLVDARTRTTEARAELRRRHWELLTASGILLSPTPDNVTPSETRDPRNRS